MNAARIVVCVPARNEAAHLPALLAALAAQTTPATVVIALNNTTDDSRDAIEQARRANPALALVIDETSFAAADAHAGSARRRAMEVGVAHAGRDGILIATDADARPPPDWVAANVAALGRGLDIVGGCICLDEAEDVPDALRAIVATTSRYWADVRALEDSIDPVPWDPPPRHGDHTGASLALRVARYVASGGVPPIPSGEDRALVKALIADGGKLGHPPDVWTRVSARVGGRAQAGMADEMARLAQTSRDGAAVLLPHFDHWRERARWRRAIRERSGAVEIARREDALPPMPCDMALTPHLAAAVA